MLLTFVTLGKYLESVAKGKTSSALTMLMRLQPQNALLIKGAAGENDGDTGSMGQMGPGQQQQQTDGGHRSPNGPSPSGSGSPLRVTKSADKLLQLPDEEIDIELVQVHCPHYLSGLKLFMS